MSVEISDGVRRVHGEESVDAEDHREGDVGRIPDRLRRERHVRLPRAEEHEARGAEDLFGGQTSAEGTRGCGTRG